MNIFLRIGNAIDNARGFKKAYNELAKITNDYYRNCKCTFDKNDLDSFWFTSWDSAYDMHDYKPKMIPEKLRFHSGDARVEIIPGKPITWCKWEEGQFIHTGVSKCNPKDAYDWKKGVIVALENTLRDNATKQARVELFAAMFKKYPELKQ
jgi:hypothetical protein